METHKIVNLLSDTNNENSKFAMKKWYIIDSKTKGAYSTNDEIKFLTNSLESSHCDYSDTCILVTGHIYVTGGGYANTKIAFKNCARFKYCRTEINETFVDKTEHINVAMPMYNLIECSNNYSDTSGSLWQFKRNELNFNDINTALINNTAPSFNYKASIIGNTVADGASSKIDDVKLAVTLKYLSNFWRSLKMLLINCKVELSLTWYTHCVTITGNGTATTFAITDTKLYVPVVTLKAEENAKLSISNEGFKRSVYWNHCKIFKKLCSK